MNIKSIREDFPSLLKWIYLDNAFVGLIPTQVREGYNEFLDRWFHFNPVQKTILTDWLEKTQIVRGMVADLIGANQREIAFTMCTGSGLNIVINGLNWCKGDNVVFPEWEHNPVDTYTLRKNGVESRPIPVKGGVVELSDIEKMIDDRTKIVQVSQVSYINGYRFDLPCVSKIAHEHGAKVLVDATQAVGACKVDVKKDNVDFVSVAPYKYLLGPTGLAFLYVTEDLITELKPDRVGWKNQIWHGDHAEDTIDLSTAEKFEYGTINFQGVYALGKSIEYIQKIGIEKIEKRNLMLSQYLWNRLSSIGRKMYTVDGTKSPIVSYFQDNSSELASWLMKQKIKVTGREAHAGHMRCSVHFYNTKNDIDNFIETIS
jgi:cysteine desulfurase/selenocysteine lyase